MSDFQSRVNGFRQGLQDQQDSYNKLASNMSQMGRSIIPDKTAARMEYNEKVGGSMTGVFAGLHGMSKLAKKMKSYRDGRNAKNNNTQVEKPSAEETVSEAKGGGEGRFAEAQRGYESGVKRMATQTGKSEGEIRGMTTEPKAEDYGLKGVADDADQKLAGQIGESQADTARAAAGLEPSAMSEAHVAGRGSVRQDIEDMVSRKADVQQTVESMGDPFGPDTGTQMSKAFMEAKGGVSDIAKQSATGGQIGTSEQLATAMRGGGGGGAQPKQQTGQGGSQDLSQEELDARIASYTPKTATSGVASETNIASGQRLPSHEEDLPRVQARPIEDDPEAPAGEGLLKRAAGWVGKKVAGTFGEEAGGIIAEGIPLVGELAGLGMLIHGIVKAHKHEIDHPTAGKTLTAPSQEATEQAGGFSSAMLKGAQGLPSIV